MRQARTWIVLFVLAIASGAAAQERPTFPLPGLPPPFASKEDFAVSVRLAPAERRTNVQDAFRWRGPHLAGSKVLLIDDVATTGSTLEACAEALLAAGANKEWALTVARALGSQNAAKG